MDKTNRNQLIGIAICAGIIIWAQVDRYYHVPHLGSPGYLEYCDRMAKAPWLLCFEAVGILGTGLWVISLLFKNKPEYWTFWMLHIFFGFDYAVLYLMVLGVRSWIRSKSFNKPISGHVRGTG